MTLDTRTVSDIVTAIVAILAMAAILDDALAGTRIRERKAQHRSLPAHRPPGGAS
jgi:hypothetical protein